MPMNLSGASRKGESGAVAVMYAILIVFILLPVSALGVDLGNAVS